MTGRFFLDRIVAVVMFVRWNFSSCHAVEMKSQQLSCSSDRIATAFAEVSF